MAALPDSIILPAGKKVYFASDFHLGIPDYQQTRLREQRICHWLNAIRSDAHCIYLLGDLFDAWMEYKRVVPKGYVRFLGQLAALSDAGIELRIFTGNHDLWMHGYFEEELGARVYKEAQTLSIGRHRFHLAHGDGLSEQETTYRFMKRVFHHPVAQWVYRQLHPDLGLKLADYFSRLGPKHREGNEDKIDDYTREHQLMYARKLLQNEHLDYLIFGHRHLPYTLELEGKAQFINLGDWIRYDTYAVYDGNTTRLLNYGDKMT